MKTNKFLLTLILVIFLSINFSYAQEIAHDSINIGNINAVINASNPMFYDFNTMAPHFEVPKASGKNTIYVNSLWIGGLDDAGQLHLAAERYRQFGIDFWQGPVMDSASYSPYQDSLWNKVWKINKSDIDYHISHWQDPGYIPLQVIADWPGNGNTNLGQAVKLAPYFDNNYDGIYNPLDGDYPLIRGDQSVFFIINDDRDIHTETGGDKLGVEVHVTAYAFDCPVDSAIHNTVFLHYDIYNRSDNNYHGIYIGDFADFDLGYANDDYIGCDPTLDFFFAYNGYSTDGSGQPGAYGNHPPAQAVTFLNEPLNYFVYLVAMGGGGPWAMTIPNTAVEYYTFLRGLWKDSTHFTLGGNGYGGTIPTNYIFPGDPNDTTQWNEASVGNYPYDRRVVGSYGPSNLNAGDIKQLDMAFVFARDFYGDNLTSVYLLKQRVDDIRNYYANNTTPCGGCFNVNIKENTNLHQADKVIVYPNPFNNSTTFKINIHSPQNLTLIIYDITGREIKKIEHINKNKISFTRENINNGLYFYKIKSSDKTIGIGKLIIN